ncbi:MAG: DUF86 domain-containing protein [Deltaproteobacteria bacterium]|nr:DUF86 domain-containing protein [Deltaproteobacteria bacterium]
MEINVEKLKKLFAETNKALRTLRNLSQLNTRELLESEANLDRVKYNFIIAIQLLIDICNHIVAKSHGRPPEDYADCFKALSELDVIDSDLSKKLSQMAKFRNLLIHLYWEVDNKKVCHILKHNLKDFDQFLNTISLYLRGELSK